MFVCVQAEENTGMGMVFTLVSSALEWLNSKWEEMIKEKESIEERKRQIEEEIEKVGHVYFTFT